MYEFSLGPVRYGAHRDGTPFTLVDCFQAVRGVGHATIYAPTGRVVLRNAGSLYVRSQIRGRKRGER